MKKKENFWDLLKRLDEEAAQFNTHLTEANRYFDTASKKTKSLLEKHEKDLHHTIKGLRKAMKSLLKAKKKNK